MMTKAIAAPAAPRWRRYLFRRFMVHVVPFELEAQLLSDLEARGGADLMEIPPGHGIESRAAIDEWCLDIGGTAHQGRPMEAFWWAGLAMEAPSDQVALILNDLRSLQERRFSDGASYFKLKLWHHATVMTPAQRDELIATLERISATADERARLFASAVIRGIEHGVS